MNKLFRKKDSKNRWRAAGVLAGMILTAACGGPEKREVFSPEQPSLETATQEGAEERGETISLPRDLAAYLWPQLTWELGETVVPADFFDLEKLVREKNLEREDLSGLVFQTDPNEEMIRKEGEYQIGIFAGERKLLTRLKIQDTLPPVITVPERMEYQVGDTIQYRKGVVVEDNSKEELEVIVDKREVSTNQSGVYKVYYSATDSAGNVGRAETLVVIGGEHTATKEEVRALAEELLEEIVTEQMEPLEKARAVFDWCHGMIHMTPNANKDSKIQGAYEGLYYKMGDCYTFFATASYLLSACGIENLDVSRQRGDACHYWSLVNVGSGWYHFDCSPNFEGFQCFMQTDEQVQRYQEQIEAEENYYLFEEADMPQRAVKVLFENGDLEWYR